MQLKQFAVAVALASAACASHATTLTLDPVGDGTTFASLDGNAAYTSFDFWASAGDMLNITSLTSTWTHNNANMNVLTGYRITNVKFDGVSITSLAGGAHTPTNTTFTTTKTSVNESWTLADVLLTAGTHTIEVYGAYNLQPPTIGFTGNLVVTPVPEPETYLMLLGGLGILGLAARRRKA